MPSLKPSMRMFLRRLPAFALPLGGVCVVCVCVCLRRLPGFALPLEKKKNKKNTEAHGKALFALPSAYVGIRQHTSTYVSIRQQTASLVRWHDSSPALVGLFTCISRSLYMRVYVSLHAWVASFFTGVRRSLFTQ
jgi:hypothetical protein